MPPARNAAILSFCHGSRSVRITTAIFVSNCMLALVPVRRMGGAQRYPSFPRDGFRYALPILHVSPPGIAGPGADHAFLAAEIVAFFGGFVQRVRDLRLDRIAVSAARIDHVHGKRRAGAFHGDRLAVALALFSRGGERRPLGRIVDRLAVGAAFADREGTGSE